MSVESVICINLGDKFRNENFSESKFMEVLGEITYEGKDYLVVGFEGNDPMIRGKEDFLSMLRELDFFKID